MKHTLFVFAIAAIVAIVPAEASLLSVNFTGTVSQLQGATGQALGNTVSGHFDLDSVTGNYLDFTIAGKSVASGYTSSASVGPALTDAIYTAQVSPVAVGGTSNSSFSLDLSSLTNWQPGESAYSLLLDANQLSSNLDTVSNPLSAFPSTFEYYTANSNGTGVVSLTANLTSLTTTTPEPTSLALMGSSLVGLALLIRRRV